MQGMFKNPLVLALLASVLLNGVLIGKTISPERHGPRANRGAAEHIPPGPGGRLNALPRYLSTEQRIKFDLAAKASGRQDVYAVWQELKDARKAVMDNVRARPYDPAAVRTAMAEVRAKADALAALSDESIASFLESRTAEERTEILRAMNRRGGKRKGARDRRGPKGERR